MNYKIHHSLFISIETNRSIFVHSLDETVHPKAVIRANKATNKSLSQLAQKGMPAFEPPFKSG